MTHAAAPSSVDLWDELRAVLRITMQVFGDPRTLLEDLVLPRAEARRLAGWIASLEAAARALLAVLAASLPKPPPTRLRDAPRVETDVAPPDPMTESREAQPTDDAPPEIPDSETWTGVVFHYAPRASMRRGPAGAPGVRRFLPVRGLALRLEALIRVVAAPEPYARRLARRLLADPGFAARALRRPEGRPGCPPPYDELVEDAFALALDLRRPEGNEAKTISTTNSQGTRSNLEVFSDTS